MNGHRKTSTTNTNTGILRKRILRHGSTLQRRPHVESARQVTRRGWISMAFAQVGIPGSMYTIKKAAAVAGADVNTNLILDADVD